jgi:ribose-phosphate pyrophosphokinase
MTILFTFPGYEALGYRIAEHLKMKHGTLTVRHFPDSESYVRVGTKVKGQDVVILCGLDRPDQKIMALMFLAQTLKELGAERVGLVAPYLGYMRQDIRFLKGEAVSSVLFARYLSQQVDWLVTIDPHLHRHHSLDEIYSIPSKVVHAAPAIAKWIKKSIEKPLLIGPDEESEQWVSTLATKINTPYVVLKKIRHGDKEVEVTLPGVEKYQDYTPLLVDDIISTGHTMLETAKHLSAAGMSSSVCVGVHAVFSENAHELLMESGYIFKLVTCNTIVHSSNAIDILEILVEGMQEMAVDK